MTARPAWLVAVTTAARKRLPIFCMGWRSYWCLLDEGLHKIYRAIGEDRCGWACERHDRALIKYWERRTNPPASPPTLGTIEVNPTWTSSTATTINWTLPPTTTWPGGEC